MIQVQAKDTKGIVKWIRLDRDEADNGQLSILARADAMPEKS